ncbi:sensor histidine kinase [Streptomyces monashensis]|uniref:sensor histidine kinase n=1 Tax=Streptomyces monashensis TaxID=1678012 RepID=UPI0033C0FEBA
MLTSSADPLGAAVPRKELPVPRRTAVADWACGVLYLFLVLVLLTGAPRASGVLYAVGCLLAASLLTGVVRRRPAAALALTLAGATAVVVVPHRPIAIALTLQGQAPFVSFVAADLALGCIVATRSRRAALAAVAPAFAVQLLVISVFSHGDFLVLNGVIGLLALIASCMVGLLFRERREHAVALRAQEVAEAVTAERLRIARELHDMVAHSIGIVTIQAGVAGRVIDSQPGEARAALRAIEDTSRQTLSGLRRTLVALRRADPDPTAAAGVAGAGEESLAPVPGLADLERLAAATADAGVRVEVHVGGEQRPLPAELDLAAYRIVQEALTNVVRHAGTGGCRVAVDYGDEELTVEVVDDGRGATGTGPGHGFGIVGMRERAGLLHGRLSAGPRPEGGFRVLARLPLPESVAAGAETR